MPDGLKRINGQGHLHFVTFSCYGRLPLLGSREARNLFVNELAKARAEWLFQLLGYVVMPEHVHLLLSEPNNGTPAQALQMLKQRVSKKLRHAGEPSNLPSFWQPRFYDFNVYTQKKCKEKLHYMHANPVLRRLVKHPKDWVWSSWGFYYQDKYLLAMDSRQEVLREGEEKTHP